MFRPNNQGQLGTGSYLPPAGNLPATADLGTGRTATDISLGSEHACAALDDGTIKCWGQNIRAGWNGFAWKLSVSRFPPWSASMDRAQAAPAAQAPADPARADPQVHPDRPEARRARQGQGTSRTSTSRDRPGRRVHPARGTSARAPTQPWTTTTAPCPTPTPSRSSRYPPLCIS